MERLDAQGSAIQCESRSLILKIRPAPELLLSELRKQLPEYFKGGFRSLIVQPENAAVWNEAELLFRDWFSTAITGIKETLESVDRKTDALPRIESLLHELLRFTAVPSAQIGWGFSHGGAENEKPPAKQEISTALESAIEAARIASRKHDYDSALKLWEEVRKQAISEGSNEEEFNARLEIILVQLRDEMNPTEALRMADECLRDSKDTNLGEERCRVLQIIGEIHRFQGNRDQARGYLTGALESARRIGSPRNEGYALLALSALEGSSTEDGVRSKAFGMIEQAFNSFSSLYASGDIEEQNMAKIGFAECHRWTATLLSCSRPDDALEAWTHSIEVFEALGESWKWDLAEALLCRAELRERLGDRHAAFAEIERSAKTFSQIGDTMGVARCYLKTGELLDSIGKRDIAVEPYKKAAKIAATWNNTPKASYFFFRHACKLMELKKYKDADRILSFLAEAEGLEKHIRLTVFSQLCLISKATSKHKELNDRCSFALNLIDELMDATTSAEERRSLLIQKGTILEELDQHDQALACFHDAIKRFEAVHDQVGIAECWFQICGIMQTVGDTREEREASERVLALGEDKLSRVVIGLTLVRLAGLNIREQRFVEAREQIDRAEELDLCNPVVALVAAQLRSELPKFSSHSLNDVNRLHDPPERDLVDLIYELREWCKWCPEKREGILPLWYYIHRTDLPGIIRSMIGVKRYCLYQRTLFIPPASNLFRRRQRFHNQIWVW